MDGYRRYAVYYAPAPGSRLAAIAAGWLGWDAQAGREVARSDPPGLPLSLDAITEAPRKYGFHGTLKPPMRLAPGVAARDLDAALAALAARQAAFDAPPLAVTALGPFLALTPTAPAPALDALAARVVADLDAYRAPPSEAELARRRASGLSARQEALLGRWGYPYVMEEFRFHLTLTGRLPAGTQAAVAEIAEQVFAPALGGPLAVRDLCLFGEDDQGRFHLLTRHPLSGAG